MSDKPGIREALAAVSKAVGAVRKDGYNAGQKFNFRGIDSVVNAVHPHLAANGIVVVPEVVTAEYAAVTIGQKATPATSVRMLVSFTFHGPAGDSLVATVAAEANDAADKATAKAHSVALRTALLQTLMLPTDDADPDESYEPQAPEQPEHVVLQRQIVELAQSKGFDRETTLDAFISQGGEGKISACSDVEVLRATLTVLKGA